eukprot:CAMPEP_0170482264 /NCGR_PEP_ID=MMETSP0208-20121228/2363_1 /TAXON_ID=197538 /ORGANISM="Strombidium inclinatum, Strain S3" /LENGTH=50 /DNA_ID=CAMNT_0010755089 /DNA_START=736 /DNA_END=888 /DNA_ORIENTATION=+
MTTSDYSSFFYGETKNVTMESIFVLDSRLNTTCRLEYKNASYDQPLGDHY